MWKRLPFSHRLSLPIALVGIIFLYLAWEYDRHFSIGVIPCALLLGLIFVMSPQINWWWNLRHPPELHPRMQQFLLEHLPFYHDLSVAEKTRFRNRLVMFIEGTEFMSQAQTESVPYDIRTVVAASAVQVTFGKKEFLFPRAETVVIYPRAFPSPLYPNIFHRCEFYEEDGVWLFAADALINSFVNRRHNFQFGIYEFGKAFLQLHQVTHFPEFSWEELQAASGWSREDIENQIGLSDTDLRGLAIHHFFEYPRQMQRLFARRYEDIVGVLGLDPLRMPSPLVMQ